MTKNDDSLPSDSHPDNKVARLIMKYSLGSEFGDELEERWTADGPERESLRKLANRFNERLLEAAVTDAGMTPVDGEVANLYRLLTDEDVSSGNRTKARRRLEKHGIDVEQLQADFVTYQAIRSYLKEYRDAQYETEQQSARPDNVIGRVQRLTARLRSVAEKSLNQLSGAGCLALGDFRLFVDINVLCEECNTQYTFVELVERGGCDCQLE